MMTTAAGNEGDRGKAISRRQVLRGSAAASVAVAMTGAGHAASPLPATTKALVFAHRGASALRPEHTLAAYAKAIADGADVVEPDLVATRDGALVVRHENNIAGTTDVARHPEFADRKTEKTIDGVAQQGWFTEDFTLAELKTLRAIERLGATRPESARHDSQFQIVSFEEMIDFVAAEAATRGRTIGIAPEIKHSTYFASRQLPLEDRVIATLAAHAYTRQAPVYIQSFEVANLRAIRAKIGRQANISLVQLIDDDAATPADIAAAGGKTRYADLTTSKGLADMARYADVVAPSTRGIIPLGLDGRLAAPRTIVTDAHRAGLKVCVWTFRPENRFLAADFRDATGDDSRNPAGSITEMRRYLAMGLDAFFTDDPALGRTAVDG